MRKKKANQQYLDLISSKNVYGIESVKFLYEDVLIPLNRYMYDGIAAWLDRYQPDIVVNDHQAFSGAIAACIKQIPYATSVTAPAALKVMEDLPKIHEWEVNQIVALQQELGIPGEKSVVCSEQMTLVLTTKEFFGGAELPAHFRFVGPVIQHRLQVAGFNWEAFNAMPPQPRILVSIGTTFEHHHKKEFFAKVVEALGGKPVTVVVISDPQLFDQWPANFLVQARVPQLELLPHLDAVVCHGGHNTVCETLSNGLPMVVIPIAYDQSYVAGRVVQVESGVRLNFKRFKAAHLHEAVEQVLQDTHFREAARQMQQSFAKAGGAAQAAKLLENMAAEKLNKKILVA